MRPPTVMTAVLALLEQCQGLRPIEIRQRLGVNEETLVKVLSRMRSQKLVFSNGNHMCRRYYTSAKLVGVGENDSLPVRRARDEPEDLPPPSWELVSRLGQVRSVFDLGRRL